MIRKINIVANSNDVVIKIIATIKTQKRHYTIGEINSIKEALGDRIYDALRGLPYVGCHVSQIKVK